MALSKARKVRRAMLYGGPTSQSKLRAWRIKSQYLRGLKGNRFEAHLGDAMHGTGRAEVQKVKTQERDERQERRRERTK